MKLNPVLVSQGDSDDVEILVVQIDINDMPIRVITGYSPKENSPNAQDFYSRLDEEIESSITAGCGTIIEMDFNAKLGDEIIKGDKHEMSSNGELLFDVLNSLIFWGSNLSSCKKFSLSFFVH